MMMIIIITQQFIRRSNMARVTTMASSNIKDRTINEWPLKLHVNCTTILGILNGKMYLFWATAQRCYLSCCAHCLERAFLRVPLIRRLSDEHLWPERRRSTDSRRSRCLQRRRGLRAHLVLSRGRRLRPRCARTRLRDVTLPRPRPRQGRHRYAAAAVWSRRRRRVSARSHHP